jgi:hypothetical protein
MTGCRVEQIQLKAAEALIKALMIYSVIAWRILYLTHLGRHSPELPCGTVFSEGEWKATCAVVKRPAIAGEPMNWRVHQDCRQVRRSPRAQERRPVWLPEYLAGNGARPGLRAGLASDARGRAINGWKGSRRSR